MTQLTLNLEKEVTNLEKEDLRVLSELDYKLSQYPDDKTFTLSFDERPVIQRLLDQYLTKLARGD